MGYEVDQNFFGMFDAQSVKMRIDMMTETIEVTGRSGSMLCEKNSGKIW